MRMRLAAVARRRGTLLAPLVTLMLATASTPARAGTPATVAASARLSNLRTVSRWAYPNAEALVHVDPTGRSRAIGHLRLLTDDGQAELYVALDSARMSTGRTWVKIELPGRPNGQTGWVPSGALASLHTVYGYLLVDRSALRATLFRHGHSIFSAPIGVGKAGTITPAGDFYVMEKLITLNDPAYGPLALGTSAYAPTLSEWPGGGIVGIHGTNEPQLIPGRPSHGCIRMHNADIRRLWSLVSVGTPIDIT